MYQAFTHPGIKTLLCGFCLLFITAGCRNDNNIANRSVTRISFVEPGPEAAALIAEDSVEGYFEVITLEDIRLQMGLDSKDSVSRDDYRKWLTQLPKPWPILLRKRIRKLWDEVLSEGAALVPRLLPDTVKLILTENLPYGAHVYFTRNDAVFLPVTDLERADDEALLYVFRHELFHLISRNHRKRRSHWFRMANYVPAPDSLIWETSLFDRRLANPDAPNFAYALSYEGRNYLPLLYAAEAPVLTSSTERFAANLRFDFFRLRGDTVTNEQLPEWEAKVGSEANTQYFIHPEEILAEHFALWLGAAETERPEELEALRGILSAEKTSNGVGNED